MTLGLRGRATGGPTIVGTVTIVGPVTVIVGTVVTVGSVTVRVGTVTVGVGGGASTSQNHISSVPPLGNATLVPCGPETPNVSPSRYCLGSAWLQMKLPLSVR